MLIHSVSHLQRQSRKTGVGGGEKFGMWVGGGASRRWIQLGLCDHENYDVERDFGLLHRVVEDVVEVATFLAHDCTAEGYDWMQRHLGLVRAEIHHLEEMRSISTGGGRTSENSTIWKWRKSCPFTDHARM